MTNTITRLFILATVVFGISACAPQTIHRTARPTGYAVPELSVPAPEKEFAFSIPVPELEEYKFPTVEFSENFSYKERNHVRACDTYQVAAYSVLAPAPPAGAVRFAEPRAPSNPSRTPGLSTPGGATSKKYRLSNSLFSYTYYFIFNPGPRKNRPVYSSG